MKNTGFIQKLLHTGITGTEEKNTIVKIKAMNKIMLLSLVISIIVSVVGFLIEYNGYIITGISLLGIVSVALLLTYQKKYELAWHILLVCFVQIFVFLPFFAPSSPILIIFFISFQFLVLVFFQEKKTFYFYFLYYSLSAILFNFFLFGLNPNNINTNPWINIFSLVIGLIIAFYSLQFYITKKSNSEAELRLEEEKFRILFENSPLGVMVSKVSDTCEKMVNLSLADMLGYTKEELEQKRISEITHFEDKTLHIELHRQLLAGEIDFFELEKRHLHKDGSPVWGKIVVSLVRDTHGNPLYNVATFLDINEQKQQQQQILELVEELKSVNSQLTAKVDQRTEDLTIANEELQRSNEELEQFAYIASHDLKEPLRMISSFVQLLNRRYSDKLDDRGREYIHYTIDGVQRMSDLISSLLQYSRVGRKESNLRTSKVGNLIEIKLMDLRKLITEKNAKVELIGIPERIVCEPVQVGLVFYNLISNGLKFNDQENPQIIVKGEEREKDYLFSIQDNGIGIEDKYKQQVFEIFKRLHTREKYEGTGIGLALCRKIIYRHNGEIWFDSEIEKGTTFYFTIGKDLT